MITGSRLRRRYVLITLLTWLPAGTGMASTMLLMAARGLDLPTVGAVVMLQGIVVTAMELPTGGVSDVFGRRGVLVLSALVGLTGCVWMAFATGVWEFVLVAVLRGVARALSTGPAEAWFVDAVHAGAAPGTDPTGDIRRGLSYGHTAESVGLGVGTLVGGALPVLFPMSDNDILPALAIPVLLSGLLYGVLLPVAHFGMVEPPRRGPRPSPVRMFAEVPATIGAGLRLAVRTPMLSRLLLTFAVGGIALSSIELFTPGRIAELTGDGASAAGVYGVITAIGFAASGLGALLSTPITALLRRVPRRAAMLGLFLAAAGLLALFAGGGLTGVPGLVATGAGYAVLFVGLGVAGPVTSELVHQQVVSSERATVISIQSLLQQAGGSVAALLLPWLVIGWSVAGAWLVSGLMLAAATLLYRRAGSHRAPAAPRDPDTVPTPAA